MGSSPASSSTKLPAWARQALGGLVGAPLGAWQAGGGPEVYGAGPWGDVGAGAAAMPSGAWGQALGDLFGPAAGFSSAMGGAVPGLAQQGADISSLLGLGGLGGAQSSMDLTRLSPNFMAATFPFYNQLQGLVGMAPDLAGQMNALATSGGKAFQGQAAGAALGQMANTGPQGDIYKRTLAMLTPEVRAGFGARGMAGSGAAIKGESDQARQLADQFAQRAMQERIGLLGQAVGGEQANAQMTGAQNSLIASLMGNQAGLLGAGIQGALGGMQAPGNIYNQFQQGAGAGIQNLAGAQGLQLAALQPWGAAQQMMSQLPAPLQALFSASRTPYLQLLQAAAGASPLSSGTQSHSVLGIPKGG